MLQQRSWLSRPMSIESSRVDSPFCSAPPPQGPFSFSAGGRFGPCCSGSQDWRPESDAPIRNRFLASPFVQAFQTFAARPVDGRVWHGLLGILSERGRPTTYPA